MRARGLVLRVVELGHEGMLQGLLEKCQGERFHGRFWLTSAVRRSLGLKRRSLCIKSIASGDALGYKSFNDLSLSDTFSLTIIYNAHFLVEVGIDSDMVAAKGESIDSISSAVGVPLTSQRRLN